MTERELQEHLMLFEKDLLERVTAISNHKRSWLYNNVSVIVSALLILITFAVGYGINAERISNLASHQASLETVIGNVQTQVRNHHEDFSRHVDADWKNRIMNQLDQIQTMISRHMARDVR